MAAKTKRKTAMSMRKAQAQREPAGRTAVGGIGVVCCVAMRVSGTGESGLGERQLARCGIVVKYLRVAAPLNRSLELAAGFLFAVMLIEEVAEKFIREGAIGFCLQSLLHLAKEGNVGDGGFAKNGFARLDVRGRKGMPLGRDDGVAFFDAEKTEEDGRVDGGQQRVHFEAQLIGKAMKIDAAALVGKNFEKAGHAAGPRVGQHDYFLPHRAACFGSSWRCGIVLVIGPRKNAVDGIDELDELWRFAVARLGHLDGKIRVDVRRMAAENDDAVGEHDGLFDIMRDNEN